MVLTGTVEITYQTMKFLTDELVYLHALNQVISPGAIRATFDGVELEGAGMELSITEERMKLQQNVKTTIRPELLRKGGMIGETSRKGGSDGGAS